MAVDSVDTRRAMEAMRGYLHEHWLNDRDVMTSAMLAQIEAASDDDLIESGVWADWLMSATGEPSAGGDQSVSLVGADVRLDQRQAFEAMRLFLEAFCERGDSEVAMVLSWTEVLSDGETSDPASWGDWLDAVRAALGVDESD